MLAESHGRSLDVATAYFTVGGFGCYRRSSRISAACGCSSGRNPLRGEQLGLRPDPDFVKERIRRDLEVLPFDEATLRLVEDLIAYLRRETVAVRLRSEELLHAKCWLFYSDRPGQQMLFDRFPAHRGGGGFVQLHRARLTSNRELNLAHEVAGRLGNGKPRSGLRGVWLSDEAASEHVSPENPRLLKSEVGARAIVGLEN